MAAGANDKPSRYKPNLGTGKTPNVGFSFAQMGYSKSNVLAAAANHPAPMRSRSMAPLRNSGGRKEPPAPPVEDDDVFSSPIKIGEIGDTAPSRTPSGPRDQHPDQYTFPVLRPSFPDDGDVEMRSWPPAPINRNPQPKTQAPATPPSHIQHQHHAPPPSHHQQASPQGMAPSDEESPLARVRHTHASPPNDHDENYHPRRLPLHPGLSARHRPPRNPLSSVQPSGREIPFGDGYPHTAPSEEKHSLPEVPNPTFGERAGSMRASYSAEESAPARQVKGDAITSGLNHHSWGYDEQNDFQTINLSPPRPPTAFARRHLDLEEAEQTQSNAESLAQDTGRFSAPTRPSSPGHRGFPPPQLGAQPPLLSRRPSLHHIKSLAQPKGTMPSFGNESSNGFSFHASEPLAPENRFTNSVQSR